jgi:hypothetical protein
MTQDIHNSLLFSDDLFEATSSFLILSKVSRFGFIELIVYIERVYNKLFGKMKSFLRFFFLKQFLEKSSTYFQLFV